MVLPVGTDKASGLTAALQALEIAPDHVAGIGDAEADCALLQVCGCKVAVQNALPSLKERAQIITQANCGDGVIEVLDTLMANNGYTAVSDLLS